MNKPNNKLKPPRNEEPHGSIFFDIERMVNALNSPRIEMPSGLSQQERREFILKYANSNK